MSIERIEAVLRDAVECRYRPNLDDIDAQNVLFALEDLRQQLAASQAREVQLREALEWEREFQKDQGLDVSVFGGSVLTLPQDTSALEAMIAKAGEVMRERCAKFCDETESQYFDGYESRNVLPSDLCEDLHNLPGVTLEDLK